ncbi:hypothetical protein CF641_17940 [Burkholderia pseudomallei]|nr:hypothetical protein CF641_17940 [Burkholderia pseudomallei]PNX38193.1 hypothetical protein CF642_21985 [Burkholderia pseudomallei]
MRAVASTPRRASDAARRVAGVAGVAGRRRAVVPPRRLVPKARLICARSNAKPVGARAAGRAGSRRAPAFAGVGARIVQRS